MNRLRTMWFNLTHRYDKRCYRCGFIYGNTGCHYGPLGSVWLYWPQYCKCGIEL